MKPMDHWQRVDAAIHQHPTDRVPVALWRHFPDEDRRAERLVAHTLEWQRRWDFDVVKFMPCGTYGVEDWGAASAYRGALNGAREIVSPVVQCTEDWRRVDSINPREGWYGLQNRALAAVAKELAGRVPLLQTVFSPLTTARKLGTERLFSDIRQAPESVERALDVITDVTIAFALDALDQGAHGVFFATQLASHRLLTVQEHQRFGREYDLRVLRALRGKTRLNMLHAHGDDIMFDELAQYPVEMLNWHDRLTMPSIQQARPKFKGLLVGGLNEYATLQGGTEQAVVEQAHDAIRQAGGRGLMLGPGCVLPVTTPEASIQAVLHAARSFSPAKLSFEGAST